MKESIGQVVSRLRSQIKAVKQDAFITDRYLYRLVLKFARALVKREDGTNKLNMNASIFQPLDYVELEEVDSVAASCMGISSGISIYRNKHTLPEIFDGYWGPKVRQITSLDGSTEIDVTTPQQYLKLSRSKNFKYNKTKYYWFLDGYFYFPDITWPAVRIIALFEGDVSRFRCSSELDCKPRQDHNFFVPGYLLPDIESQVLRELGASAQLPPDPVHDKQNINR